MRSAASGLHHTLTPEAASVLKHSLALARRRGHAHLTPLHVAATLLSLRSSSLRTACLNSHPPHPLQCRALELCFNVALNRLPTTPPSLHNHHNHPSLSNALIAALKRAQAHHRRAGCIDQPQQQPLLSSTTTVKLELEQLIISILDDPSVSRVMREAGFSSTAVKNNLHSLSHSSSSSYILHHHHRPSAAGGVFSSPPSPPSSSSYSFEPPLPTNNPSQDDIKLLLDVLVSNKQRKNTVIVGDSVSITQGLVAELMARLERAEVPDELKSTRVLKFHLSNLSFMKREQVEMRLSELEKKVVDCVASGSGGVIVYLGDLKWTAVQDTEHSNKGNYSPMEHVVAEIGKLFCSSDYGISCRSKVWLMATATYQTYIKCQMRKPPLDTQWALHALPVPSTGLALTLHASTTSVLDSKTSVNFNEKEEQDKLNCCEECASNYEKEAQLFKPGHNKLLPSWLQSHPTTQPHQKDELSELRRKWNRLCHSVHHHHQSKHSHKQWSNSSSIYSNHSSNAKIYPYPYSSSSYPWWPNQASNNSMTPDSSSISFSDSMVKPTGYSSSNLVPRFRRQQSCTIEFNFSNETQKHHKATEASLDSLMMMKGTEGKEVKITLALGDSSFGDSGQTVLQNITHHDTTLRRAHICELLQENVPWQSQTLLSSIAEAVFVDPKSAKANQNSIWLFMQGNDCIGKRRLARAIAESAFGSAHLLFNLDMRKKENLASPCCEMLSTALKTHQQLVVLIENAHSADAQFRNLLTGGFETGKFGAFGTEEKPGQAIFIFTNNDDDEENEEEDVVFNLVLQIISETKPNLNLKRKAEWDLLNKFKRPRIEQKQEVDDLVSEQGNLKKKEFSRQSSFNNNVNSLDLNIRAEEEDGGGGERSCMNAFLDSIENRFVVNGKAGGDKKEEMGAFFVSKMKGCFGEVCGKQYLENFSVEEKVIEEMSDGCGSFTNRVFEKWVKDIFQSSLQGINLGGKEEGIVLKLCWGGKGNRILDCGFMRSCLPTNIQVNYSMD